MVSSHSNNEMDTHAKQIEQGAAEIEQSLDLVVDIGVEDRLTDEIPRNIANLRHTVTLSTIPWPKNCVRSLSMLLSAFLLCFSHALRRLQKMQVVRLVHDDRTDVK